MIDKAETNSTSEESYTELLRRYEPLLVEIASDYYLPGGNREDLLQEARIALKRAYDRYDPEYNVPFSAFAALCVRRQLQDSVQKQRRKKHEVLNKSNSLEQVNVRPPSNTPDPESQLLAMETLHFLQEVAREALTELEQQALAGYLAGESYSEMAQRLEKDEKSVDNALSRARRKIACEIDRSQVSLTAFRLLS